ncbi:tetratricopeptide repeat protein [uncultured Allobaculum sp.]|nr:tetratricopeptide repeat protein [uncultured Allobaculum sp.]
MNAFKKTLNDSTGADVYSTRLKWEAYLTGLEATLLCEEKDMDGVSNLLKKIEDMIQNSTTGYAFCKEYLEKTDLMLKAWLSREQEDYVQSARTLRQLEKILLDKGAYLSPSDQSSLAHIYRLMGENYMRLNKPACARSYFEKAIKRISDIQNRTRDDNLEMILCLYGLGESHSLTGSEKQAKSCYQMALLKMQDCTVEKNQLNKDKIDSEKVSMRFPEAAASIRKAGLFFERQRDPERAIQFYREALNQLNAFPANSDHPDSLENVLESDMGRIFYGSGDLETALGHFEKSVQSARKDYDLRRDDLSLQNLFTALSNAALCALQSGDHIRALKHFVSWWKIRSVLSAEDCASCDTLLQDEMI